MPFLDPADYRKPLNLLSTNGTRGSNLSSAAGISMLRQFYKWHAACSTLHGISEMALSKQPQGLASTYRLNLRNHGEFE